MKDLSVTEQILKISSFTVKFRSIEIAARAHIQVLEYLPRAAEPYFSFLSFGLRPLATSLTTSDTRPTPAVADMPRLPITGKPTDNPYVESFNGKLRDECPSLN